MNLQKKKSLAMRTLGVGRERIVFVESRLNDIKEAITKQDIRDLVKDGAIFVKNVSGRARNVKSGIRNTGKIRKKIVSRKKNYIALTRKLRNYVKEAKNLGRVSVEQVKEARKGIRNNEFRSKQHLKAYLRGVNIK